MSKAGNLKEIGGAIAGFSILIGIAAIGIGLLYGAAELSVWAIEWAPAIFGVVLLLCLIVLAPLSAIHPARGFAGNGFYIASYLFGLILWVLAMAFTYSVWGLTAVIIGLVFFGVGVVPVAILAAIIEGQWGVLGNLAILIALTFGLRIFGVWLVEKAAERAMEIVNARSRSDHAKPARRLD